MADITNLAYMGTTGTLTIDTDTHFGVNSFRLTPNTPVETYTDIAGDVQSIAGKPAWVAEVDFNQDHKTADSLSRQSHAFAGTAVPFTFEPQDGGEVASGSIRWVEVPFGGDTARRTVQAQFNVIGQPTFTPGA